jgi:glucuronokinase
VLEVFICSDNLCYSAIVVATLNSLMRFYNVTDKDMPKEIRPQFVLDVEREELFIQAGLQDRVTQVYEGLVYMDFSSELMQGQGHGQYINLEMTHLPQFWLAYLNDPSDSGRIHSNVKARWERGDNEVHDAMKQFGELTSKARVAIEEQDWNTLAALMNSNFDLRRKIYGDECLGSQNIEMIEIARRHGSAVKFPGSGGAVVGLCLNAERQVAMKEEFFKKGFVFCEIVPYGGDLARL